MTGINKITRMAMMRIAMTSSSSEKAAGSALRRFCLLKPVYLIRHRPITVRRARIETGCAAHSGISNASGSGDSRHRRTEDIGVSSNGAVDRAVRVERYDDILRRRRVARCL